MRELPPATRGIGAPRCPSLRVRMLCGLRGCRHADTEDGDSRRLPPCDGVRGALRRGSFALHRGGCRAAEAGRACGVAALRRKFCPAPWGPPRRRSGRGLRGRGRAGAFLCNPARSTRRKRALQGDRAPQRCPPALAHRRPHIEARGGRGPPPPLPAAPATPKLPTATHDTTAPHRQPRPRTPAAPRAASHQCGSGAIHSTRHPFHVDYHRSPRSARGRRRQRRRDATRPAAADQPLAPPRLRFCPPSAAGPAGVG